MILSWPALFSNRVVSVPPCVYVCPSCVSFHRLFWLAVHILSAGCVWVFSLCLLLLFELQTEMPPVNFLSHPPFFLLFLFLALSLLFCFALLVAPKLDVSQCDKTIKDKRIWVWFSLLAQPCELIRLCQTVSFVFSEKQIDQLRTGYEFFPADLDQGMQGICHCFVATYTQQKQTKNVMGTPRKALILWHRFALFDQNVADSVHTWKSKLGMINSKKLTAASTFLGCCPPELRSNAKHWRDFPPLYFSSFGQRATFEVWLCLTQSSKKKMCPCYRVEE